MKRFYCFKGHPRVQFKPRGLYQVTTGDKVTLECFGYGYPIPALAISFPDQFNVSSKFIQIKKKKGYIKLQFYAEEYMTGLFSCNGVSRLGERQDIVNFKGRIIERYYYYYYYYYYYHS